MKPGRIFWGVFFLVVGLLLMLDRLTPLHPHIGVSWKFWPALLVFWGLALAISGRVARYLFAALGGILAALLMLSAFGGFWEEEKAEWGPGQAEQTFHERYDSTIVHAAFSLESAGGSFILGDTTHELLTAETESERGTYTLDRADADSAAHLSLRFNHPDHGPWFTRNMVRIRLNPEPAWDIRFDVGASRLDVDASSLKVSAMSIAAGAADVKVRVGDRARRTDVSVKTGASSVTILVPEASGCELRVNAPLSSREFRGFSKVRKGFYQTENFDSASTVVSVDLNAGVSSLRVIRY